MKHAFYFLIVLSLTACARQTKQDLSLWYERPAERWLEAIPVGNGRLGAMLYGGIDTDRVALNESTLWSGQFDANQEKPFGTAKLSALRDLFFQSKLYEGNQIAAEWLRGNYNSFGTHLPMGEMHLYFTYPSNKISNYKRTLYLETATCEVTYTSGDIQYKREYFASNPDDVMVIHLSASKPKALNFDLTLDLIRQATITTSGDQLTFAGKVDFPKQGPGGVNFIGQINLTTDDGTVSSNENKLSVQNASTVTLIINIRTNYKNDNYLAECNNTLKTASSKAYDALRAAHLTDYSQLFNRTELFLGESENSKLPTDIRLRGVKKGKPDVGLDALFFQYGRYLLIASSRENSPLPAALQAMWNDNLACNMGWTNDYHLDINTQQNYWLANVGNLAECNIPLFSYIKDLSSYGEVTAQTVYGCRGWTAHTVANVWGYTAPSQNIAWGLFPLASSWLVSHVWRHYLYTQDKDFLANEGYPLLKGNATFLLDYLVEAPNSGYLVTGPSISPENWFIYKNQSMGASMMPTGDRILSYEILASTAEAAEILEVDKAFADSLSAALAKLPPLKIGKDGSLQEWLEDYEEASPNHRHTMHLLGVYPFNQINPDRTPKLALAAAKVIENKLASTDWEDTEWSRANMMCSYARLKNAKDAYNNLQGLFIQFAAPNLFTCAPSGVAGADSEIFEFDANQAAPAGIAEMLLQSQEGYIEFLPALPEQWKTGHFKGLCVEGGGVVDLGWEDGKVKSAKLTANVANTFSIKHPTSDDIVTVNLKPGESWNTSIK
jgi:alpha-L-fucosidase 2